MPLSKRTVGEPAHCEPCPLAGCTDCPHRTLEDYEKAKEELMAQKNTKQAAATESSETNSAAEVENTETAKAEAKHTNNLRSKVNARAHRILRDNHRQEWDEIMQAEYKAEGLTYRPRLSPEAKAERDRVRREEKAAARLEKLVEQYPDELSGRVK